MDDFEQGLTEVASKMRTKDKSILCAGTAAFILRARDQLRDAAWKDTPDRHGLYVIREQLPEGGADYEYSLKMYYMGGEPLPDNCMCFGPLP